MQRSRLSSHIKTDAWAGERDDFDVPNHILDISGLAKLQDVVERQEVWLETYVAD